MRIVTTFLLIAGVLVLPTGAAAQYGLVKPSGSGQASSGQTSSGHAAPAQTSSGQPSGSAAVSAQPASGTAVAPRVIPLHNLNSDARTIEITASAQTPAPAPAPVAPQLRGTSSEPAVAAEPRAEGLRSALTGVPLREPFRPMGRVARGPHQPFEAPGIHVPASEGTNAPAAVSFEELN